MNYLEQIICSWIDEYWFSIASSKNYVHIVNWSILDVLDPMTSVTVNSRIVPGIW